MGKSYLRKYTLLLRSVISFEIPLAFKNANLKALNLKRNTLLCPLALNNCF
ncbi:MAG: hypothetical protein UZ12_BCD005001064 [Bacteroidetes bacterium OLB12]|nr:MAG: hypothetical protein UZ12_BCD005001064 [Bacteroidetes bacterium OLB12]